MHDGLSARRTEARTSFTRSPSVAFNFSINGFSWFGFVRLGFVLQVVAGRGFIHRLEIDIAVFLDAGEDNFIDLVIEDENLEIFLLVDLEQRRGAEQGIGASGHVVDALLAFLHARLHIGEAGEPLHFGGLEADQVEQRLAIGEVAVKTLPSAAGCTRADELEIQLGLIGRNALQFGENLLDAGRPDTGEDAILLQDLAAHIQRKVFAVDDAADEAQILRQKLLGVVHDEDALDVELDSGLVFSLVEIERSLRRDIEERSVVETSFRLGVEPEERVFPIAGDRFVELLVVLVFQLAFGAAPESTGGIDLFRGPLLDRLLFRLVPLALVIGKKDGERDVVGVLLHDLLQAPAIGVLLAFLVEVKQHGGAGDGTLRGLDVEAGLAIADPTPGLVFTGLARNHLNLIRHHEGAVEAHAKLTDQIGIFPGIAGELGEKILGAGAGDRAQVRDQILLIHADAGVGDGQCLVLLVELQIDARIKGKALVSLIDERQVAELVQRIGGVGDELPEEDLRMRIERVDDQLQQLVDFGLEFTFRHYFCHL